MNMNEALQQSLYDKLSREQDTYRHWLKGQPPEEILHHSYEYTVREDILMSMEKLTLSEAETRALLLSPSPMAILYDKFSDLETGYMDTIRDSIEETAKDEAKKLRELPVYPYPADHARENGELDVYRASFRANVSCKDAIEAAIRDNYHDNRLDAAAVGQVAEQFGQERMLYVLAATVRHFDYDGRISRDNKRWANTIPVYENKDGMDSDRSVQFVVSSHPGLTDLFLTQARHEQRLRHLRLDHRPFLRRYADFELDVPFPLRHVTAPDPSSLRQAASAPPKPVAAWSGRRDAGGSGCDPRPCRSGHTRPCGL